MIEGASFTGRITTRKDGMLRAGWSMKGIDTNNEQVSRPVQKNFIDWRIGRIPVCTPGRPRRPGRH